MRIAFTTTFDATDIHNWSGTPCHMAHALQDAGAEINYIGSLKRTLPPLFKIKQTWNKVICNQRESPRFNITAAKSYSEQVAKALQRQASDAVISPLINPIAYLDCKQPIILWTDATYAALLGFYPPFNYHSANTIQQGNAMTTACLSRVRYAVFCSDWAAESAIQLYGMSREKVKVIPFGANIENFPTEDEVKNIISNRAKDKIKLLFLAKSWERKGGDIVLAVAKALHDRGEPVELTIVGYEPPGLNPIPPYVKSLGYISKHTADGKERIQRLLAESHFLFVPSLAEAYGIVFCEANAYGVPCLTTHVGGISTIIKDNLNGMTFGLDAPINTYCDYITTLMQDCNRYNDMARASYHEFKTRLNWQSAAKEMTNLISTII